MWNFIDQLIINYMIKNSGKITRKEAKTILNLGDTKIKELNGFLFYF